jgi:hypothetical protein
MLRFVSWRLCVKRDAVGFDLPFAWGSLDDAVKIWWPQSRQNPAQEFYLQTGARGSIVDLPFVPAFMEGERKRLGFTDEAERKTAVLPPSPNSSVPAIARWLPRRGERCRRPLDMIACRRGLALAYGASKFGSFSPNPATMRRGQLCARSRGTAERLRFGHGTL